MRSCIVAFVCILASVASWAESSSKTSATTLVETKKEPPLEKPKEDQSIESRELPPEPATRPVEAEPPKRSSAEIREQSSWAISGNISPLGLILPFKYGATVDYIASRKWMLEVSYMEASLAMPSYADLGSAKESLTTYVARVTPRNSFSFFFGLGYHKFNLSLSDSVVAKLPAGTTRNVVTLESLGITGGIGNRWQFDSGFHVGCDWIAVNVPLVQLGSKDDGLERAMNQTNLSDLKAATNFVRNMPQFMFLKIALGYTF